MVCLTLMIYNFDQDDFQFSEGEEIVRHLNINHNKRGHHVQ